MQIKIHPLTLKRITNRVVKRLPVAMPTRTHGVWDLFCGKMLPKHVAKNIAPFHRFVDTDERFYRFLLLTIMCPIKEIGYYDCISFGAIPGMAQDTLKEGIVSPLDYHNKSMPIWFQKAIQNTNWHDGLIFRRATADGNLIPFYKHLMQGKTRIVTVGPKHLTRLADVWPHADITHYDTKFPKVFLFTKEGDDHFNYLHQQLREDILSNDYTVYLFQAGAVSQYYIYDLFLTKKNHAYFDIGRSLNIWTPSPSGEPPGGWFFNNRATILNSCGEFLQRHMSSDDYMLLTNGPTEPRHV